MAATNVGGPLHVKFATYETLVRDVEAGESVSVYSWLAEVDEHVPDRHTVIGAAEDWQDNFSGWLYCTSSEEEGLAVGRKYRERKDILDSCWSDFILVAEGVPYPIG